MQKNSQIQMEKDTALLHSGLDDCLKDPETGVSGRHEAGGPSGNLQERL